MSLPDNPRLLWLGLSIGLSGWCISRWDLETQRASQEQTMVALVSDSVTQIERSSQRVQEALDSVNEGFVHRSGNLEAVWNSVNLQRLLAETRRDSSRLASLATGSQYAPERAYLETRLRILGAEARLWRTCESQGESCLANHLGDLAVEVSAALTASEVYQQRRDADLGGLRERRSNHSDRVKAIAQWQRATGILGLTATLSILFAGLSIIRAHRRAGARDASTSGVRLAVD